MPSLTAQRGLQKANMRRSIDQAISRAQSGMAAQSPCPKDSAKPIRLSSKMAGAPSMGRKTLADKARSEEHTSELQSLMRISYAVFCLKKKMTQSAKIDA